ncbi:MAG: ABC transporter ATP-binding protein [Candidatus Binataceae bacterium]
MPADQTIVEVSHLRKKYGSRQVLEDVTFDVSVGEIVGLLGPNGAGKTTTLSIMATLLKPDAGAVRVAGHDARSQPREVRRRLGLVPQSIALYLSLSAIQNAELFARMQGLGARQARIASHAALEQAGLIERAHDPVSSLSGGLQRRVNLVCGIVHRPAILLLDEPTVGVDPQSRERIIEALRVLAGTGVAIIYSTHYMEEVERLCDRALLIDCGRLIAAGTIPELIALAGSRHRMEVTFRGNAAPRLCEGMAGISETLPAPASDRAVLMLSDLTRVNQVLERALNAGCPVLELSLHSPNLSDAFMTLTGHALRDNDADQD